MSLERSLLGGSRTFQTDSNRWMTYTAWPPAIAKITHLYLRSDGTLSFTAPAKAERPREYISVPANPVPYRAPPIPTIYLPSQWRPWEISDQRFVDHRPDVLAYISTPLGEDLVVTGAVASYEPRVAAWT